MKISPRFNKMLGLLPIAVGFIYYFAAAYDIVQTHHMIDGPIIGGIIGLPIYFLGAYRASGKFFKALVEVILVGIGSYVLLWVLVIWIALSIL